MIDHSPAENIKACTERVKRKEELCQKKNLKKLCLPAADGRIEVWGSLLRAIYFSLLFDTGMRPEKGAGLSTSSVFCTEKSMAIGTVQSISCVTHDVQKRVKNTEHGYDQRVGVLSTVKKTSQKTEKESEKHQTMSCFSSRMITERKGNISRLTRAINAGRKYWNITIFLSVLSIA